MSETYRLIDSALGSTRQVYEQDTEATVKQLETIRQVNTSTTLRHIRKEEELKQLAKKAERIESTKLQLQQLDQSLFSIESNLSSIERIVDELDEFTAGWGK